MLEIGDIIEQEALEFLHSQGVEVGAAKIAFDLVGGSIVDLKLIVDTFHHDMNFDGIPLLPKNDHLLTKFTEITRKLFRDARAQVAGAQIMPGARYHDEGSQVIKALLKRQRSTEEDYYQRFGFDIGYSLLDTNVFALHVESGIVTLQSRLIERYCESQQDLWRTGGKN